MKKLKKSSSFTLIELLVVIVIIGILAGVIVISTNSAVTSSQNTKLVANLSNMSKALEGYSSYPKDNLCIEDTNNNSNFISSLGTEIYPKHPNYPTSPSNPAMSGTNDCFLYFSDGNNYSIRIPAQGNNGYLIQESRNHKTQDIAKSCESGWIPFGNRCVMKYEAKCSTLATRASGDGGLQWSACTTKSIVSDPAGDPITDINQEEAKAACESIGAHLITNAEWMAIARDIELVKSNWTGGAIGSGVIKKGNVGAVTGGYDGDNPEYGTGRNDLAKLKLSNGQEIWDFSGNVWEWVDNTIPLSNMPSQARWTVFPSASFNNYLPKSEVIPLGSYTDNYAGGAIYYGSNTNNPRAFLRGGYWYNGANAGVFALYLDYGSSARNFNFGFRCAR
jgi:prepilin-type N-terminal cleavage/methylation domain-containing protein